MCGIAGQYLFNDSDSQLSADHVKLMIDHLRHRGPDALGIQSSGNAIFGHARLKIIDMGSHANQPMSRSSLMLVFNGEIYNYIELRKELSREFDFVTQSDTEVILAAYRKWGLQAFSRFNGDWAIALYDDEKQELVLSRDRFGVKPLYFHCNEGKLTFASEIGVFKYAKIVPEVSREDLLISLRLRKNEFHSRTLARNIHVIKPGTCLIVDRNSGVREHVYYSDEMLCSAETVGTDGYYLDKFDDLFVSSVALRYRADVPVGVCLSGGLDSSCIVAAAKMAGCDVVTFSAGFPGDEADESEYFKQVIGHYGNRAYIREDYPDAQILEDFDKLVLEQDAPHGSMDTLGRSYILDWASRYVKVVLDGQGGDEIFGGYNACYSIYRKLAESSSMPALEMELFNRNEMKSDARIDFNSWFDIGPVMPASKESFSYKPNCMANPYSQKQFELVKNNLLSLLHTEDRLTMARSIEGRVPFLDHRLVEFCLSLPLSQKIGPLDKMLMRRWGENVAGLPGAITRRRDKKGFSTPFRRLMLNRVSKLALVEMLKHKLNSFKDEFSGKAILKDVDRFNRGEYLNLDPILYFYSSLIVLDKWHARLV